MASTFRFCLVCRGADNPMIKCSLCRAPFHLECLSLQEKDVPIASRSSFICPTCKAVKADDLGNAYQAKADDAVIVKTRKNREWLNWVQRKRKEFLNKNSSAFENLTTADSADYQVPPAERRNVDKIADEQLLCYLPDSPTFIKNAELRGYQLDGVSRICSWFCRGVGGILADEMGLGKTIQTIAFISSLKHKVGLSGPHLVITPLAVLQNWSNELNRFAPDLSFKKIYGSLSERYQVLHDPDVVSGKFDVYLTTYETLMSEEAFFSDSWPWVTLTIDEGHRIKNENAALRFALNRVRCPFRLILTGTPLQNNLHELWALLNFILPEIFKSSTAFDKGFNLSGNIVNTGVCESARTLLEEHMMIRRIKRDVESSLLPKLHCNLYSSMSHLQMKWYTELSKMKTGGDASYFHTLSYNQMRAVLAQLRKVVNHPKQILLKRDAERAAEARRLELLSLSGAEFYRPRTELMPPTEGSAAWKREEELRSLTGEALIASCGKLRMLDRLLLRLRANGHRCLIFSQYVETLDVLEEYVSHRFGPANEAFYRLDGSTNRLMREINTRGFNSPDSKAFIYLISTRAGGMGINLATADSVILYDSCPNPQVDLQAQDRAHRIGQKKQVTVYRLITTDCFEERVLQMADKKMLLDALVISAERSAHQLDIDPDAVFDINELRDLLGYGSDKLLNSLQAKGGSMMLSDNELDAKINEYIASATVLRPFEEEVAEYANEDDYFPIPRCMKSRRTTFKTPLTSIESEDPVALLPVEEVLFESKPAEALSSASANEFEALVEDLISSSSKDSSTNFDLPRVKKAPRRYSPPQRAATKKPRKRISEDVCFCCGDGGSLVECDSCPKVYHLQCLGLRNAPKGRWDCFWHACIECDRNSSNSGGLQFRCLTCPVSYCFDCYPPDRDMIKIDPPLAFLKNFDRRGYAVPKNGVYYQCIDCEFRFGKYDANAIANTNEIAAIREAATTIRVEVATNDL